MSGEAQEELKQRVGRLREFMRTRGTAPERTVLVADVDWLHRFVWEVLEGTDAARSVSSALRAYFEAHPDMEGLQAELGGLEAEAQAAESLRLMLDLKWSEVRSLENRLAAVKGERDEFEQKHLVAAQQRDDLSVKVQELEEALESKVTTLEAAQLEWAIARVNDQQKVLEAHQEMLNEHERRITALEDASRRRVIG